MNISLRIVFMGNGDFALTSLIQISKIYKIVGVVTNIENINKKNYNKLNIKKFTLKKKIPIYELKNINDYNFFKKIKKWNPNLQIVISFKKIPKKIWNIPKLGTFNLHPSYLPNYRGAAPINWVIINGEKKTGVTTFFINEKIDSGKIILQKEIFIKKKDTVENLYNRLSKIGAFLVIKSIKQIVNNKILTKKQYFENNIQLAPKIHRSDCIINWKSSINNIFNKIRGLSPYPGAWTNLKINNKKTCLKIYKANIIFEKHNHKIGKVIINTLKLNIAVNKGYLSLLEIQLSGKKKMRIKEFINGIFNKKIKIIL